MAEDQDKDEWERKEGRWTRRSEETSEGDVDEGTRYIELPDGEVVRERITEEEIPAEPEEPPEDEDTEESGGLFGRGPTEEEGDDEPPEDEEAEDAEDDGSSAGLIAVAVIVLILLVVAMLGAAILDIYDPLGLRDTLALGENDPGTGGTGGNGGGGGNNTGPPDVPWNVTWEESSVTLFSRSDTYLDSGEHLMETLAVNRSNVTRITVQVTWDDSGNNTAGADETADTNEPDSFIVNLTSPNGRTMSVAGNNSQSDQNGVVDYEFAVQAVPTSPSQVMAPDEANATKELLDQQPPTTVGTGDWELDVFMNGTGGQECPSEGGVTLDPGEGCDDGNNLDVTLELHSYEGRVVLVE